MLWLKKLKRSLGELDDIVFNTPGRDFSKKRSGRLIVDALKALDRLVLSFLRGGPSRKPMEKRTGNKFLDWLNKVGYQISRFLDKLDTKLWYGGRGVRTKSGVRVRSQAERKIAELLDKYCITYRYEHPLVLDGIKLKPDFFLPKEGVYIEFWGLSDAFIGYQKIMEKKKKLYKKHRIKVISIYPAHMRNLEKNFAKLYMAAIGNTLPVIANLSSVC